MFPLHVPYLPYHPDRTVFWPKKKWERPPVLETWFFLVDLSNSRHFGREAFAMGVGLNHPNDSASWWFQPQWKILVKIGSSSPSGGKNKKYLKPPPRFKYLKWRVSDVPANTKKSFCHLSYAVEMVAGWLVLSLHKKVPLSTPLLAPPHHQKKGNVSEDSGHKPRRIADAPIGRKSPEPFNVEKSDLQEGTLLCVYEPLKVDQSLMFP